MRAPAMETALLPTTRLHKNLLPLERRDTPGPSAKLRPRTVIEARGLTRIFRTYKKQPGLGGALRGLFHRRIEETVAANDVSFEVAEGEIVGFLGPNGAGKTTTLKMLAGLLHPTAGTATVLGFVPWERRSDYQRQMALLLGQKNQLWWDLPARDSLQLNSTIYGIPRAAFERTLDEMSHMLHVSDKLDVMVRELSLGERMKMELIAALLHRPKVLFLDEPTIGLDVVSQQIVREFLRSYNQAYQTTIILTSHYMADIEALCRRVIIIDRGQICFDGALAEILERFADYKFIEVTTEKQVDSSRLRHLVGSAKLVDERGGRLKFKVAREDVAAVCKVLLDQIPVHDLTIQDVSTEEVFRNVFSSPVRN